MTDIKELFEKCRSMGATFILTDNERIKVKAPSPLPDEVMDKLREAKPQLLHEIQIQGIREHENWILEEWRRLSIPHWRRILKASIETENKKREEYARWMLREILQDEEYREDKQ